LIGHKSLYCALIPKFESEFVPSEVFPIKIPQITENFIAVKSYYNLILKIGCSS